MYDPPLLLFALSLSSGTVQDFGCVHDRVRGPCTDSVFLSCIVSKKMTVMCIFFSCSTNVYHNEPYQTYMIFFNQCNTKEEIKTLFLMHRFGLNIF